MIVFGSRRVDRATLEFIHSEDDHSLLFAHSMHSHLSHELGQNSDVSIHLVIRRFTVSVLPFVVPIRGVETRKASRVENG